jgi:hypothetical protein
MPITGRTWTVAAATQESPFAPAGRVAISEPFGAQPQVIVTYLKYEWTGDYDPVLDKVVITPSDSTHWELVGSGEVNERFTMYGMSWTTTVPDAMASWVAEPQDS